MRSAPHARRQAGHRPEFGRPKRTQPCAELPQRCLLRLPEILGRTDIDQRERFCAVRAGIDIRPFKTAYTFAG